MARVGVKVFLAQGNVPINYAAVGSHKKKNHKWWAVFSNVRPGKYDLVAQGTDTGATADTVTGVVVSRLKQPGNEPIRMHVDPPSGNSFCPFNFYAYGLLTLGDNYLTTATMTETQDASGVAVTGAPPLVCNWVQTYHDTGIWLAEFDEVTDINGNVTPGTVYTFQGVGDVWGADQSYRSTDLRAQLSEC
jgi:hypothetical protein